MKFEERTSLEFENEGQKLFAILHRPLDVKNPPIVVMFHGFGGHKSGDFRVYVKEAEMLAKCGIASFRFDFRGCGDSEGDWLDMTIGREVSDAIKALDVVGNLSGIDTSRMGFLEKSLGGLVAVMAARKYGHIKSMALWAPTFHAEQWREFWEIVQSPETTDETREQLMKFDGLHANEHFLREFFELKLEDHLIHLHEVPLLHIHGVKDTGITIEHAYEYEKHRKGAAAETKIIRLPNTDHDFAHAEDQAYTLEETCQWFVETL